MSNPFEIPVGDEQLAGTEPFTYRNLFETLARHYHNDDIMNQTVTVRQFDDSYADVTGTCVTKGDPNDCLPAGHLWLDALVEE